MLKIFNFEKRLFPIIAELVEFTNHTFSQNILIGEDEEENERLLCFCEENKLEAFYYLGLAYGYLQIANNLTPLKEIDDEIEFCFCCVDNPLFTIKLFALQPLIFIENVFRFITDLRGVVLIRGKCIHANITIFDPDDVNVKGIFCLGYNAYICTPTDLSAMPCSKAP